MGLDSLQWFKENAWARRTLIAINLGGIAYGFYYYALQFSLTPAALWVFVPDSPLAVLWATVALVLHGVARRRSPLIDTLAFVANVQVGLWTVFVLLYYSDTFQVHTFNLNFWLLWLHLGMVVEAFVFVPDLRRDFARRAFLPAFAGVVGWVLLNDVVDYFGFRGLYPGSDCGLRPITVPCTGSEALLAGVTFGLTAFSAVLLWALARRRPGAAQTPSSDAAAPAPAPTAPGRSGR